MKNKIFYKSILICTIMLSSSSIGMKGSVPPNIKEEVVTYTAGGVTLKGFVAYDANIPGKRPAILIVPEWWGLNDYPKMRARKLAESGYIAMAVDVFGDGKIAANPTEAQELTTPFYKDPSLAKARMDAALNKIKEYKQTDSENIAVIGYCFGGYVALNYAKLGANLKGVVSFHGGLGGAPVDKNLLKAKVLVCHGASDKFVSQKDAEGFKHKLDSIGADNTLKIYPNATHAFTNPAATETGKKFNMPIEYNAEADRDSWNDMKVFLDRIFKK
jgi:dienelactone hydrolase